MPLGTIWEGNRLGLGNPTMPLATQYAYNVLDIWYTLPSTNSNWCVVVYTITMGVPEQLPTGIAVLQMGKDRTPKPSEKFQPSIPNMPDAIYSQGNQNLFNHRSTNYNQIYYLNNEPEFGNVLGIGDPLCDCWTPNDRGIDPAYSNLFCSKHKHLVLATLVGCPSNNSTVQWVTHNREW